MKLTELRDIVTLTFLLHYFNDLTKLAIEAYKFPALVLFVFTY